MKCAVIITEAEKPGQAVVRAAEVVVAVIKMNLQKNRQGNKSGRNNIAIKQNAKSSSTGLQALTAAALVLPGLMLSAPCAAEDDEMSFQQSHYEESKRNLYNVPNNVKPIQVDSLDFGAKTSLTDRVKFSFNYTEDTWSGATPLYTAPAIFGGNQPIGPVNALTGASPLGVVSGANVIVDKNNHYAPVALSGTKNNSLFDPDNGLFNQFLNSYQANKQLAHVISVASPETRKQGDFKVGYEWDRAALKVGGGTSVEKDYKSDYGNLGGYFDFNQKLTRLNLGLSFTNSDTSAQLDPDFQMGGYENTYAYSSQITKIKQNGSTVTLLQGNRQDWGSNLGLTQVLTENSLVEATLGYTRSNGYMSNPYKAMGALFVDPNQYQGQDTTTIDGVNYLADGSGNPTNILSGTMLTFLEKRPTLRNQFNVGSKFVQYIKPLDAALHFDYHFSSDDWGITSHAFESDWVQPIGYGWTVTPRVRYYSQEAASFYTPYLLVTQKLPQRQTRNGPVNDPSQYYKLLPDNYSSDQRLSGFGTLSGGVSLSKKFAKGITLETSFEYYTHAGSLKLGGGGEGDYANFNYYVASAGLTVNLSALGHGGDSGEHSHQHDHQHGAPIPAGVMFGHMMEKAGEVMVGYRYMYSTQAGSMLNGENAVPDKSILNQGCSSTLKCYLTETGMNMHMHMLDLMYAPTDWLNLMLMPQFVDMNMSMKPLPGAAIYPNPVGMEGMMTADMANTGMSTGGIGDTGIYSLFKLFSNPNHHVNLTLGATAPTADVGRQMRRTMTINGGLYPYGMQLGSGTWDFKPSMTYTGKHDDWSWGAQVNGTKRLENKNDSGYALGDIFQSSAWGSYNLLNWLSTSVRGVYTAQGSIKGQYNGFIDKMSPSDYTQNYGGKYWDVGFGVNAFVPSGDLAGNSLSFEWLQPVATEVNGYQLARDGALSATWGYAF